MTRCTLICNRRHYTARCRLLHGVAVSIIFGGCEYRNFRLLKESIGLQAVTVNGDRVL